MTRVAWTPGTGMFGALWFELNDGSRVRRRTFGIASNAELVGRIAEFFRSQPKRRKTLRDIDDALTAFELHH